jgi:glycine/D-amino acid oxidase-like deaminating enzyme
MARLNNYWFDTCHTRKHTFAGLVKNVDVLIIGGGISGISLLFRLLTNKIQNTYLIEEDSIGFHASGRTNGQLTLGSSSVDHLKFLFESNKRMINGLSGVSFDTDLCLSGGLNLASDQEELERLRAKAEAIENACGFTCPLLIENELRVLISGTPFVGGIFLPTEVTFNPYKVVNGLHDLIEAHHGIRCFTGTQVEDVSYNDSGTIDVSIRRRGTIRAKHVVYCTGGYTSDLLPELRDVIRSVRTQTVATGSIGKAEFSFLPSMGMTVDDGTIKARIHNDRMIVSGFSEEESTVSDGEISKMCMSRLTNYTKGKFPFLDGKFEDCWSSVIGKTPDGLPLVGPIPEKPNQYVMAGFNSMSFEHSVLASMIVTQYIQRGETSLAGAELFDPKRF